jgi:hypothetical protein
METVDVKAITLAKPQEKLAIARHAWEALPPVQRRPDNLAILQEAITHDPPDFVRLCKEAGLPVMVVNVHNETHNHYHGTPGASAAQEGGLTAADVLAIVQAAQRPQEAPTGVSEMMALMAQQQQRSEALLAAMMAQQQQPQQPQHIYVESNPNITVSQTAGEGGGVMIIAGLFFGVLVAVIAGS